MTVTVIPALSLLLCVHGPATVGEDGSHIPEKAPSVTSADFDARTGGTETFAVVEFYSAKCPVCTSLVWVIDSLYETFSDTAFVAANNTDDDTLYQRFAVTSVPTYVLFKSGAEVARRSFAENRPEVYDTLASLLKSLVGGTLIPDTVDTTVQPDSALDTIPALDVSTFDTTVLRPGTTAMVFFLYAGGAPCIHMDSVVKTMLPGFRNRAVIAKVHAWDQRSLSDFYGISYVPQFLFFKDGAERVELRRGGIVPGDTLAAVLERLIADTLPEKYVVLDKYSFGDSINVADRVAMVDFFSPTCPACMTMNNVVSALADTFDGAAMIAKVNVLTDDSLAAAQGVESWPTFIFYRSGVEYRRIVGTTGIDTLAAVVRRGLDGEVAKRRVGARTALPVSSGF